jgi:predicted small integral membrane protein
MLIVRYAKIVMSLALAAFCLLVTIDNIIDYNANYAFVQHVLSMDTVFPDNDLKYRDITSPTLWHLAYAGIIAAEGVTGALFLLGAIQMTRAVRAAGAQFDGAKAPVIAGALVAFLVWFFGFMVVGGEWFDMWQSKVWNGQEAAFRFYVTVLAVLIFVNQPDRDLAAPPAPRRAIPKRRRTDK